MVAGLAGVVLAAGAGRRLRPLSDLRPKALCPIANVPLVDLALARIPPEIGDIAVNIHHGRAAIEEHLAGRGVHCSIEADRPLGTAGALGHLRGWLAGRAALVVNADAWCPSSLGSLVDGWDGARVRLLIPGGGTLRPSSRIAGALLPWSEIERLAPEPSGLYELSWARAQAEGRLEVIEHDGPFIDCGTPADYLTANLAASGGASVVGEGAIVAGELDRSVVWSGAVVWPGETLSRAIRPNELTTVLVR